MRTMQVKTWAIVLGVSALMMAVLASTVASNVAGASAQSQGVVQPAGKAVQAQGASGQDQVVTVTGLVSTTSDADGDTRYTITVDGQVVRLDAGPGWFHGDTYPLEPFVGKTVTVTGEQGGKGPKQGRGKSPAKTRPSGPDIDVFTVTLNGQTTVIRTAGKPPWAGGPKVVGSKHPGYGKGGTGE
jgi:hypothetical protein